MAAIPFLQLREFAFLNYDDPMHVTGEPMVLGGLSPEGISWALRATPSNLWHPLTWISFMAEVSFFGGGATSPAVHHLGNLVLHLAATGLFFLLLRTLGISLVSAFLAALLFSLHPLHVEPVAWISSRKELLSSALGLCAVLAYTRQKLTDHAGARRTWRLLTFTTLLAALASKPSAVVIPALFVLVDALLANTRDLPRNLLHLLCTSALRLWPCFLFAAITTVIAVTIQYSGSHQGTIAESSLWERLRESPMLLGFYAWRSLMPNNLVFEYPAPLGSLPRIGLSCLGILVAAAIPWLWLRATDLSRKLALALLWFVVCLSPVLGLVYVGTSFTTDRYAYLALGGLALAVAFFLDALPAQRAVARALAMGSCVLLIVAATLHCRALAAVWKNDASLFRYAVAVSPRSPTAQINVATVYRMHGDTTRAQAHYLLALELSPGDSVASYNLAQILLNDGQPAQAITLAQNALRDQRLQARAHYFLGSILGNRNDPETFEPEKAFQHLSQAHARHPENPRYTHHFAQFLIAKGKLREAVEAISYCKTNLPDSSEWTQRLDTLINAVQSMQQSN